MHLKINKACDLSSISVLPPPARKLSSVVSRGVDSSSLPRNQGPHLRSQQSQYSFSQGVSSSHLGMFSQQSQNSFEPHDQKFGSQERENSVKRFTCLPHSSYSRDDVEQKALVRSSTNLTRKWDLTSSTDRRCMYELFSEQDILCQVSEELEGRISVLESSLKGFGRSLDSVQSDILQVNKGIKEALMQTEGIRLKLIANDNLLQLLGKVQEDIKTSLNGVLSLISDSNSQDMYGERLKEISLATSALPEEIRSCLLSLKTEFCKTITQEMQGMTCSSKTIRPKLPSPTAFPAKELCFHAPPQQTQPVKRLHLWEQPLCSRLKVPQKVCDRPSSVRNIEVGSWTSVKKEHSSVKDRCTADELKQAPSSEQEKDRRVVVELDEEINGGLSCLLEENSTGNCSMAEVREATERILRKARRRKRKHSNLIILD